MILNVEIRQALDSGCTLGEGALWDAGRELVWFVDIKQQHVWHYDPASGASARAQAPEEVAWVLPADDGTMLCGLKGGLWTLDPATQRFAHLQGVPGEPAGNRNNDACTDPRGRVWLGTMDDAEKAATGRYYLFDRGDIVPAGPAGIAIANGPAVNREGTKVYFTDTPGRKIMVGDIDGDGHLGEVKLFADVSRYFPDARPDGPVCDAEGFLWSGLYGGGHVARFAPDGALDLSVPIPTSNPTKLCFGGSDMKTAYVTTARAGLSASQLAAQPLAGSLLAFDAPVAGFAQAPAILA